MLDLTDYRDYLSEKAHQILNIAIDESKKRKHNYLGAEHIFLAFTKVESEFFQEVIKELKLEPKLVIQFLDQHLNINKQYVGMDKIPPETKNVFKSAWEVAQKFGRKQIEPTDLFTAIFQESKGPMVKIFRNFGIEPDIIHKAILRKLKNRKDFEEEIKRKYELPSHLKYFGVNLNKLAYLGKFYPLVGREKEIEHMIEILSHRERANSVMILGETGVGKTAVAEGLAQKIEMEPQKIPPRLRNAQIVNLQMNSIVSGTMFRGMFEDRIEKIINEIKEDKNIILFIDEAHTLIGAGTAMGVHSDAANIFKSTLARGEVQIIGATTQSEYKTYIQEDEALDRRFKVVKIEEPSVSDTRKILFGIRPRLEKNYSVKINDSAIDTALSMSPRYIRQIRLPDKAISWLNTACVKVEINRPHDEVKASDIFNVISQESGIPLDMVFRDTNKRFANVEKALSKRVVGQKEAIKSLAKHLRLNKGPLKENYSRPDGVLLFLGPTGVGKTEMAKSLADFLFGDENKMVRLDMSEYKDGSLGVDKLIGMPRGIVGSERGGILTNQIRDNPFTVLLLDEMEKASSFVLNLFLQVFDEGWLTDGRGKKVYFSDAIIVMTSNLGSHEFMKYLNPLGFLNKDQGVTDAKKTIMRELENTFPPEFLNRIDDIIVFSPLTRPEVKEISKMYLASTNSKLKEEGKKFHYTSNVLDSLVESGFSLKYGARFLKRTIDDKIKIPLTLSWNKGSNFYFRLQNNKLRLKVE